jgi:hypothetical protein
MCVEASCWLVSASAAVDDCRPRRDDGWMELAPGVVARVIAGPFAGHEVVVIEPLRNNLVLVLINLLDGATRLELSVLDSMPGPRVRGRQAFASHGAPFIRTRRVQRPCHSTLRRAN